MKMAIKKLKNLLTFRHRRYVFFGFMTTFTWLIPWMTVNGNHFFLLSFDHKRLDLFFVSFSMQELYLMPFVLMFMFIGVFAITVVGGRAFCGWGCPQTVFRVVFRDFIETRILGLRKRIENKQEELDCTVTKVMLKRFTALMIWFVLAFLASADLMWFFVPPEEFFGYLTNWEEHPIFIGFHVAIALFLIYDIIFMQEKFCIYVCPYSRIQSVLYDDDTVMAIYDHGRGGEIYDEHHNKLVTKAKELEAENECTTCEACVRVCPTHIDIRKGLQLECINCLECVDACTKVMGNLGKPSLVQWSSIRQTEKKEGNTRFIRSKTVGYAVVLLSLMAMIIFIGSSKEHMQLNINKENRLYQIIKTEDYPYIYNTYIFNFENTQEQDHTFYFEVANSNEMQVIRPNEPFRIGANKTKKKPVIIATKNMKTNADGSKKSVPIIINAYAVDSKERININRQTMFIYPPKAEYEAFTK